MNREVCPPTPSEREPHGAGRIRRLGSHAYGSSDAPVAFYSTLNGYLLGERDSLGAASLKCQVSTRDPFPCFAIRLYGVAFGVFTTHLGDISGCEDQQVLHLARRDLERRFGVLKVPQVGAEWSQAADISARLIREKFTNALNATPAIAQLRSSHQRLPSIAEIRVRQRSLGELRSSALVSWDHSEEA